MARAIAAIGAASRRRATGGAGRAAASDDIAARGARGLRLLVRWTAATVMRRS